MKKTLTLILIVLISLAGCARIRTYIPPAPAPEVLPLPPTKKGTIPQSYEVNGQRYYPLPDSSGFVQYGMASWYGRKFQGRRTSSGEIYDMYKKTAAHKTLPLGTYVKVTNLANHRYDIVRINDRGPFMKGRIIDLSYATAKDLGAIGPGVVDVKIVALGKQVGTLQGKEGTTPLVALEDFRKGVFTVQVGAFKNEKNALRLAERLRGLFNYVQVSVYVDENKRTLHRVRVSKTHTLAQAAVMERKLEDMGFGGAFIVRI